jgi:hypothetical protein
MILMSQPTYTLGYTGDQVKNALGKIVGLKTFEFTTETDEVLDGQTYHVFWKIAPTTSNEVVGFTIHPESGQLCEVISAAGSNTATSVKPFATNATVEDDTLIFG